MIKMEICPLCKTQVLPMKTGQCPSCRQTPRWEAGSFQASTKAKPLYSDQKNSIHANAGETNWADTYLQGSEERRRKIVENIPISKHLPPVTEDNRTSINPPVEMQNSEGFWASSIYFFSDNQIVEAIKQMNHPGSLTSHEKFIVEFKKEAAKENMGLGVFLLIVGILSLTYGVADIHFGLKLPMGVVLFLLGIAGVCFGPMIIIKGRTRLASASNFDYKKSLETLCMTFYYSVFCKRSTDTEGRENFLMDIAHLIPSRIWRRYQKDDWEILAGKNKKLVSASTLIECSLCHKSHEHCESFNVSLPISYSEENKELKRQTTYMKCRYCKSVMCYLCLEGVKHPELIFICPQCGKARNGMTGLGVRWDICRGKAADEDSDFEISRLTITPYSSNIPGTVNFSVTLTGKPFGEMTFMNCAIKIGGYYFLVNPEPIPETPNG